MTRYDTNAIAAAGILGEADPVAAPSGLSLFGKAALYDTRASRCAPRTRAGECSTDPVRRALSLSRIALEIAVSRDEEHVAIKGRCGAVRIDFGSRAHHYLLLTLARLRAKDRAAGLPETSCGWVELDELCLDADMSASRINIDVFRIRRQFQALGVVDGNDIVERRHRLGQLRIGTTRTSIRRL